MWLRLNKDTLRLFSNKGVWEYGGWSVGGCPADITGPVLWSQVHLWPQVLCEQYSLCAKHTQTLPPDTDGKPCTQCCSHFKITQGLSIITCENWDSSWNKCTIYHEKGAERRASVKDLQTVYLTINATLSYPCSHVTQLTAEEREHMILQHIFHLILIDLFLSKYERNTSV